MWIFEALRWYPGSPQDPPGWLMAPWTFSIKFLYDTQFIFGSLMFTARDDGNLELLTQGPVPRHHAPVYGQAPYLLADPSTSNEGRSGLNPHVGPYYLSAMMSQEYPIRKTILQLSAGASSSSSSRATLDWDSTEDYPKIGDSACWNPAIKAQCISMVGPARSNSQNSSSKYPTIGDLKRPMHEHPVAMCSKFKPELQYSEAPDDHGVNSVDGPARLPPGCLDPTRG
jgi:hypothetical protein